MPRTVILAAFLPATPDRIYEMYFDPKQHAAFSGAPVEIGESPGSAFRAFEGMLSGTILHVEPKRLIVQTWRSGNWPSDAIDSTLTLSFWPDKDGARIELVQANVPDEDFAGVCQGWEKHYWTPWREYLGTL